MRHSALFLLVSVVHGGWVVEQKGAGQEERVVVGTSACKIVFGKESELIADFAKKTVWYVDHVKKTVREAGLDEYLRLRSKAREYPERAAGPGTFAGLACDRYSYSYNNSKPGYAGGWGGGESCYTKAVSVAEPYRQMYWRWLKAAQGSSGEYGLCLWMRNYVDGPPRVNLDTLRAVEQAVSPDEFRVPGAYKRVAFVFE